MVGGNGAQYRARSERDAEAFRKEMASRPGPPKRTRRELAVVASLMGLVFAGWGLAALLG